VEGFVDKLGGKDRNLRRKEGRISSKKVPVVLRQERRIKREGGGEGGSHMAESPQRHKKVIGA